MPRVQPNEFFQKLLELFPKMAPYVSTNVQRAEWVGALVPFDHDFAMEALRQYYRRHTGWMPSLATLMEFFEEYHDEKRRAVYREQKDTNIREMLKEEVTRAAGYSSPQDVRVARLHNKLLEMGCCHPRDGIRVAQQWEAWVDADPTDPQWATYCREQVQFWTQGARKWHQENGSAGPAAKPDPTPLSVTYPASQEGSASL